MEYSVLALITVIILIVTRTGSACKSAKWRNMSMEELLIKSSVVVYGKDVDHGKFRLPTILDARFDVYCVIKKGRNLVPSQVIIEDILNAADKCSGVREQTLVGKEYIVGLQPEFSGFMTYADINPLQKTAFPVTAENLNKLAAACDLDQWKPPSTGDQLNCPAANKPRFCTKIRDPDELNASSRTFQQVKMVLICLATIFLFY